MESLASDLANARAFLRASCDGDVPLDRLEVTYVQAGPEGPVRVLYEGPGRNGDVLRVTARRVKAAKAREIERAINARDAGPAVSTGFAQRALYAPALDLLFQVFPTDDRIPSLPVAIDGAAMVPVLESALAPHAAGSRLQSVTARVMRYKPERKCLLRYDLAWCDGAPAAAPRVVWARVARRANFERTRNILPRVHPLAAGLGFEMPEPLGVVPQLAMELFGAVPRVARTCSPAPRRSLHSARCRCYRRPGTAARSPRTRTASCSVREWRCSRSFNALNSPRSAVASASACVAFTPYR